MLRSKNFIHILILSIAVSYLLSITILVFKNFVSNYPPDENYILKNESLMGGDFIAFYTGGYLAKFDRKNLYNFEVQKRFRAEITDTNQSKPKPKAEGELPFAYPPLVAAFFSLFSLFEFDDAFYLWTFLNVVFGFSSLLLLSYFCGFLSLKFFPLILLFITGYIPYSVDCLAGGQISSFGIFIFSLIFILLKIEKKFFSGLILSLGYYKPPLFLFFSVAAIFLFGKRFFWGCITGAVLLTALSILFMEGLSDFSNYLSVASKYTYGQELIPGLHLPPIYGMGIFGLYTILLKDTFLTVIFYILTFAFLLFLFFKLFYSNNFLNKNVEFSYVFILAASLGLSLQINDYDLSILLPAFIILFKKFKISKIRSYLILLIVISFYVEWMFREILILNFTINLSSLLFFIFFIVLIILRTKKIDATPTY